ncbi:NYN domain-containing protein [Rhodococcus sp. BH2-1]|nr:NYN domain-containing protein [Rhodococcus sp. BH2-1]
MALSSAAVVTQLASRAPVRTLAAPPVLTPARECGRAVHFVDIENLCGTSDLRIYQARLAMRDYHAAVGVAVGDHVIIGASHHNAIAAGAAWPGARLLAPRSGRDGADDVLHEAIRTEHIADRFDLVYLASGDGGFGSDLAYLASGGTTTHVVARRYSLAASLRLAAHHVTILPTTALA